jgi:hypothetical protein
MNGKLLVSELKNQENIDSEAECDNMNEKTESLNNKNNYHHKGNESQQGNYDI